MWRDRIVGEELDLLIIDRTRHGVLATPRIDVIPLKFNGFLRRAIVELVRH